MNQNYISMILYIYIYICVCVRVCICKAFLSMHRYLNLFAMGDLAWPLSPLKYLWWLKADDGEIGTSTEADGDWRSLVFFLKRAIGNLCICIAGHVSMWSSWSVCIIWFELAGKGLEHLVSFGQIGVLGGMVLWVRGKTEEQERMQPCPAESNCKWRLGFVWSRVLKT